MKFSHLEIKLHPEIERRLKRQRILEEDIKKMIHLAERSETRLMNADKNQYIAQRRSGHITFWVRYHKEKKHYVIDNVYFHRSKMGEACEIL